MFGVVKYLIVLTVIKTATVSETCPIVSQITEPVDHSECPTWDSKTNLLFFVDIHSGRISLDIKTNKTHYIKLNGEVAPVIPDKEKYTFIAGLNKSIVSFKWNGKDQLQQQKILATVQTNDKGSRFNDGKADKKGRIWIGSMGYELDGKLQTYNAGRLFKVTKKTLSNPTPILIANISNGCAWNRQNTKFFYIDTPTYQVAQYDFNYAEGEITNKRIIFDFRDNRIEGVPDGMTIDKDDNLWIADNGGWNVLKVNPNSGELLQKVSIPAAQVTSLAWGGEDFCTLFVTTSRFTLNEEERKQQPLAGSVFAVGNLNTCGLPMFDANVL